MGYNPTIAAIDIIRGRRVALGPGTGVALQAGARNRVTLTEGKHRFVRLAIGRFTPIVLCVDFEVSPKTGQKDLLKSWWRGPVPGMRGCEAARQVGQDPIAADPADRVR